LKSENCIRSGNQFARDVCLPKKEKLKSSTGKFWETIFFFNFTELDLVEHPLHQIGESGSRDLQMELVELEIGYKKEKMKSN
jgi:hypothetical protein